MLIARDVWFVEDISIIPDSCYPSTVSSEGDQVNSGDESAGDEVFSTSLSSGDLRDQRSLTESASNRLPLQRVPSDLTDADSGINIENASCSFDTNPEEEQEEPITEFVTSSEYADFLTLSGNAISAKSSTSNSCCVSSESDLQYADDLEDISEINEQLDGRCEESQSCDKLDDHKNCEIDDRYDSLPFELPSELCEKLDQDRESTTGVIKDDCSPYELTSNICDEELNKDKSLETGNTNDDSSDVINIQDNETDTGFTEDNNSAKETDQDTVGSKSIISGEIKVIDGYCIARENDNPNDFDGEKIFETTGESFPDEIIQEQLNNITF